MNKNAMWPLRKRAGETPAPTDWSDVLQALYRQVLDREPDPEGFAFHLKLLDSTKPELTPSRR